MNDQESARDEPREPPVQGPSVWHPTAAAGRRVVYLLDANGGLDRRILADWLRANADQEAPPTVVSLNARGRRSSRATARDASTLDACLATADDPLLIPLRVIWLGPHPASTPGLLRLLVTGDHYEPGAIRKHWTHMAHPDRVRVIVGEPAPLCDLRRRWQQLGGTDRAETSGLSVFVARQAALALDRAERRVRGMRYKVPRFVADDILHRAAFRGGMARLAWESGRDVTELTRRATHYLKEIAASHGPHVIDVTAHFARALYRRGYRERLNYDRGQLEHTYALGQRSAVVFLPSHKSNLDHLVLRWALYENGHPPNHTAGGINMNFVPVGPLLRRSGVFFIRRTFKDNAVYKFVLGQYIDYLVEKRFPLEWYIEGGRSRSGKLLPPRFGLLAQIIDSYRRGKSDDVWLIPVSIAYDHIQDVGSYVSEQRGGQKERENFRWLLRVFRMLKRRYGQVYIRFGEPLSLRDTLGAPVAHESGGPDERSIALQKIAFEVSARINRVTPVTATSLVTLALLGAGDRALSLKEAARAVSALVRYVRRRKFPDTGAPELESLEGIAGVLAALVDHGIVSSFLGGPEAVYAIRADQHLAAAYYRNTVIHFFVNTAIVELALLAAPGEEQTAEDAFWREVFRLRDLLKFEFFFADRDAFRDDIATELALHEPGWRESLRARVERAREILLRVQPLMSHLVLRPFVEAYRVVADVLLQYGSDDVPAEPELLRRCLGLGKQYHLQHTIRSGESVSNVFFATGLRLAANRGLLRDSTRDARTEFAAELCDVIRRIDAIEALTEGRRTGLLD